MHGQISVQLGTGISVFNGDLGHHSTLYSHHDMASAWVGGIYYDIHPHWKVGLAYTDTKLSGGDHHAKSEGTRQRNLSFYTDLKEISTYTSYYFADPLLLKVGRIRPFLNTGLGFFTFNPMASSKGVEFELQPLSTEGQGLPGSKVKPYGLIGSNINLGAGVDVKISDKWSILVNATKRWTNTDYIDDVSGNYYDLNLLRLYKGDDAVMLAYRKGEVDNDYPDNLAGTRRGNPKNNDGYFIYSLKIAYKF